MYVSEDAVEAPLAQRTKVIGSPVGAPTFRCVLTANLIGRISVIFDHCQSGIDNCKNPFLLTVAASFFIVRPKLDG
jgi:hypothetical protein